MNLFYVAPFDTPLRGTPSLGIKLRRARQGERKD
jgi:hypothetical protein